MLLFSSTLYFLVVVRLTDNSLESVKQKLELLHMNSLEEKFNDQTRSPQDPPRMHLVLQVKNVVCGSGSSISSKSGSGYVHIRFRIQIQSLMTKIEKNTAEIFV
jgi:hypothetical protein